MNKYISAFILGAALVSLNSCEDYLNEAPQSTITPENFFTSPDALAAYALNFYTMFPNHSDYTYQLGTFIIDNGTDNQVGMSANSLFYPANNLTPTGNGGYWGFTNIRNCNFFFNYVLPRYESGELSGSLVEAYMGEMYFFRAYSYWVNYRWIGDYPIITELLPDDETVLMENTVRQPRNLVARQILDDLSKAIQYLPESGANGAGKQRLNRACAQLLRSRVALFEGTWLKYHKGTALVPGGPGWPGDASLLGSGFNIDSEINYFLTEAMNSAEPVASAVAGNLAENTATEDGYSASGAILNPYYAMYTEQNLDGFDEVLLYRQYNMSQSVTQNIYMQLQRNGGNSGWTRGLVNTFVMQNGLPIYASGSGYDANWENQGVTQTLTDRDTRIQIFTKGDNCITSYGTEGIERFQEGWLATGTGETRLVTGFGVKKGMIYSANPGEHNHGVQGSIIFRATEAMLNYIEACVELNGSPNGTAASFWQALRNRAKVDPDYSKTIGATNMTEEGKWDWGAYSAGALIDATLYNVRRERRCELIGEGLRMDDLRRWRAMDQLQNNPYQIEGVKFWGTVYDISAGRNPLNLRDADGVTLGMTINGVDVMGENYDYGDDAESRTNIIVDVAGGTGNMSDQTISGDYVHPYQISTLNNPYFNGLTFTPALYLAPIGQATFRQTSPDGNIENSVVYQNPGWSKIGNEPVGAI